MHTNQISQKGTKKVMKKYENEKTEFYNINELTKTSPFSTIIVLERFMCIM